MAAPTSQGWQSNQRSFQPPPQQPSHQGGTGNWAPSPGHVTVRTGHLGPPSVPNWNPSRSGWNSGYQHNPHGNAGDAGAPAMPWLSPEPNPGKQMPRPPSLSYRNIKLSNNGLGFGGVPRREDPSKWNEEGQLMWRPRSLEGDHAIPTQTFDADRGRSWDDKFHNGFQSDIRGTSTQTTFTQVFTEYEPALAPNITRARTPSYSREARPSRSSSSSFLSTGSMLSTLSGDGMPLLRLPDSTASASMVESPDPFPRSRGFASSSSTNGYYSHSSVPSAHYDLPRSSAYVYSPHDIQSDDRRDNPFPSKYKHERLPPRKVRGGFWNKRGDHLTSGGFVVYAPPHRTYPEELRDYPDVLDGYMNEHGSLAAWQQEQPTLPDSLPYGERPPMRSYESFVSYVYPK